jgi:hypothetical protein
VVGFPGEDRGGHMTSWASAVCGALFDWAIPASARLDADTFRRAKRVTLLNATFFFWSIVFAGIYPALGSFRCGLLTLSFTVWLCGSLLALRHGKSVTTSANLLCLGGCTTLIADAVFSGGSLSPPLLWLGCAPVVAVTTAGTRWAVAWLVAALAAIAALVGIEAVGISLPNDLAAAQSRALYYAVVFGSVACQFLMVWVCVGFEQRALVALHESNRQLAQARKVLESLETGFGFSLDEWTKLKREKQALEFALRCGSTVDDLEIDEDLDELEAELEKIGASKTPDAF